MCYVSNMQVPILKYGPSIKRSRGIRQKGRVVFEFTPIMHERRKSC
jgi:hypothetical protein